MVGLTVAKAKKPKKKPAKAPKPVKAPRVKALTLKQNRFVDEYLIDFNARAAAKRAGYSGNTTAGHLMSHPLIMDKIQAGAADMSVKAELNAAWVTEKLKDIVENPAEMGSTKVAALDKIAKRIGYYEADNAQKVPDLSPAAKALLGLIEQ